MLSDRVSRVPAMRLAELHAQRTTDTYAYVFSGGHPAWNGQVRAGHYVELPFVLGTYDVPDARGFVTPSTRLSSSPMFKMPG